MQKKKNEPIKKRTEYTKELVIHYSSFHFPLSNHEVKSIIFSAHEDLWNAILSQDKEKVKGTVKIIDQEAVDYVNCHLKNIVSEDSWHPAQQASATFALQVI